MLIPRKLTSQLKEIAQYFPIISLTGPRQAGKTTLLRFLFPDYEYVSLENPDTRAFAQDDPKSFLQRYAQRVIIDEAQKAPDLFSYLQEVVDLDNQPGRYILSGSQNFLLHKSISQSLAGRVGILRLFPFTNEELKVTQEEQLSMEATLFKGFYPRLFDRNIPPTVFYPNYIETYLQRDIQDLINPGSLSIFYKFLQLCAGHIGQLVNYSQIANSIGVNLKTIKSWLSILEQSYTVFQVFPFYNNFNKRIIKTPKLYFYDTGLACNLLGMKSSRDITTYYQKGALFENLVIAELVKQKHSRGERPNFYFWRDSNGNEMDLIEETLDGLHLLEIKATRTLRSKHFKTINKFQDWLNEYQTQFYLLYGGDEPPHTRNNNIKVISWRDAEYFLKP